MRSSERYGHKAARRTTQVESIDGDLRISLWSLLGIHVWNKAYYSSSYGAYVFSQNPELALLCQRLWFSYFKKPLDTLGESWSDALSFLRQYFFGCEWWEVYDFLEFIANNFPYRDRHELTEACNATLEREMSAYRFVNGRISRITDRVEVDEIDRALETARGPVRNHLQRALEMLSDRKSPDYRNSIKESISAVESLVGTILGEKGTLGQLIKKLEDEIGLHPALRTAFSSLYGYTSDEGGIRHAMLESKDLRFEDAKFFLVVCSAFVNFVESKVAAQKQPAGKEGTS